MTDEAALPVPHFPGYRILSSLGSYLGTQRFKAIQVALGRPVVLHVLTSETAKRGMCASFFDRQQNVLATLRHENVVGAIEAGEVDGSRYIVTEYVDGTSLADALAAGPPWEVKRALSVALDVARALAHLESLKLVHREISPRTIVLADHGPARVVDFRRAKFLQPDGAETWHDTPVNIALYTSPEVSRGENGVDIRSDIYSLGSVLYQIVCGRPPFYGRNPAVVLDWQRTRRPRDPRWLREDLPKTVAELLDHCLRKTKDTRYPTAKALCADLELLVAGRPIAALPGRSAWERPWTAARSTPLPRD